MHKTGIEEYYTSKGGKKLQFGFTTGTCAAAASAAAARMLLSGQEVQTVDVMTPKGIRLNLEILETERTPERVTCAVKKYSGDDPDVTNGVLVYASVTRKAEPGIVIDGGVGVGRVTKPGLQQKIGEAAINRVPKQMIRQMAEEILEEYNALCGLEIVISIPQGVELAKKTFNPNLGIVGGISVLGTSGIVEPMSEAALIESINVEIHQKKALGFQRLLLAPGNYGADFMKELHMDQKDVVKFSNFWGQTLDKAAAEGFEEILIISHIGKVIKVAGGAMNTHSSMVDGRAEFMAAAALRAGCDGDTARDILGCVTTDEMLNILESRGLLQAAMEQVGQKVQYHVCRRAGETIKTGVVIFSTDRGILCKTGYASQWLSHINRKQEETK